MPIRRGATRVAGPLLAAALVAVWLVVYPHTPDLAAQVYRVGLYEHFGLLVWDEHWYAGHHLPGYSLLFPAIGELVGIKLAAGACALVSTILFGTLTERDFGPTAARWGAVAFAVGAVGDIWLGRLAFAMGVTLALASGLALRRGHLGAAALLAAMTGAASPVAGFLLGLGGLTVSAHQRRPAPVLALGLPAAAVVVPLALLFPEGGSEPFPLDSFLVTVVMVALFLGALPREAGLLRAGGVIYLAACLLCLVVHSPIGSNIERYGVLLAGPLLLCALVSSAQGGTARRALTPAAGLALALIGLWVLWGPVRETEAVAGSPGTETSFYVPVIRFLDDQPGGPFRIEVPLTRSHWEAALLAPAISLARGWEKQLDSRYDGVLLRGGLNASNYRLWLEREAVSFVALPDVTPDPSSAAEARLIRGGLPYLQPVFHDAGWRVFRVLGATPLAAGPGRLSELGHDTFALRASGAGTFLVRIHFTRYWTLTAGAGCVERGPEGFTDVTARRAGTIRVAARFSLGRVFGSGGSCRG